MLPFLVCFFSSGNHHIWIRILHRLELFFSFFFEGGKGQPDNTTFPMVRAFTWKFSKNGAGSRPGSLTLMGGGGTKPSFRPKRNDSALTAGSLVGRAASTMSSGGGTGIEHLAAERGAESRPSKPRVRVGRRPGGRAERAPRGELNWKREVKE